MFFIRFLPQGCPSQSPLGSYIHSLFPLLALPALVYLSALKSYCPLSIFKGETNLRRSFGSGFFSFPVPDFVSLTLRSFGTDPARS